MTVSDGSTADYYELPSGATQLQDLISHRNLNAQDGEIFRAVYRKGRASHSDELRDARKVLFYAKAEVSRLEKLQANSALSVMAGIHAGDKITVSWHEGVYQAQPVPIEPASEIDDESPRADAIGQNGNTGEHYDDLWAGAPDWAKFKAQDRDGKWCWFELVPLPKSSVWFSDDGNCLWAGLGERNVYWKNTMISRK